MEEGREGHTPCFLCLTSCTQQTPYLPRGVWCIWSSSPHKPAATIHNKHTHTVTESTCQYTYCVLGLWHSVYWNGLPWNGGMEHLDRINYIRCPVNPMCTSVKIIKNEIRCRDGTVPKTVGTRSHCKVWLRACNNLPQPQKTKM